MLVYLDIEKTKFMKKLITFLSIITTIIFTNQSISQVTIWSEDFQTSTGNDAYTGANGTWTLATTGTNAAEAGKWRVNDTEAGNAAGACGSAGGGDQSLFMGTSDTYYGLGVTGAAFLADPSAETNKRFESPTIDCSAHTSITIEFDYIEGLIGSSDPGEDATLWYFDGTTWAQIDPIANTASGCSPQGTWTNFTTFALPASAANNANVKFGFQWTSDTDANGVDPSFAVDDIIVKGIVSGAASISASITTTPATTTICEGTTLTFTDNSTASGTTITSWAWTFDGEAAASSIQNPPAVTFNTAGTYDIILTASDGTITNNFTQTITVNAPSDAGNSNSADFCSNASPAASPLDLNTLLGGTQDAGGTWVETSGTMSGAFTAGTGMFDGNGLTVGNIYTFDYTVLGTIPCPNVTSTITITITDCAAGTPPTAIFTPSQTTLCAGDCITFAEASTPGDITNWGWNFDGGATNSTLQDPGSVCFNTPGTYDVTLTVVNSVGNNTSAITTITVNAIPTVTINTTPSTTLCTGDQVTLAGNGADSYTWTNGVVDGIAFTPPIGSNTYTVTGTSSGCTNTADVTINVSDCVPMIAGFSFSDNICVGSCIDFTDTTSGNVSAWSWDFGAGVTPINSTDQNPTNICFNTSGTYSIQLTVTDAGGNSVSTTNMLTVFDLPTVTAVLDTIIDLGGNADLIASSPNVGNYLWTPNTFYIDCDTCSVTFATPQVDTDYFVTFTDFNGCTAQDTVSVIVNFIEGIGVPQAFSPNNDGKNDLLVVKGLGLDKMNLKIYNRYGQLVFESNEQEHGWDGTFKGKDENPGVFVWVLEYKFLNQSATKSLKGNTTLIR